MRFAPHEFSLAGYIGFPFSPANSENNSGVERIPGAQGHGGSNFARRVTQEGRRRYIPFIPLFCPSPLRKSEVALVFNDRVTTGKAVATNAKPRAVTRETRETIKTS